MRRGYFERDSESDDRHVYRLRWAPESELDDRERNYAQFIRYLIANGRLTELVEHAS